MKFNIRDQVVTTRNFFYDELSNNSNSVVGKGSTGVGMPLSIVGVGSKFYKFTLGGPSTRNVNKVSIQTMDMSVRLR